MIQPAQHENLHDHGTGEAMSDSALRPSSGQALASPLRIKSKDLFRQMREIEIEHEGRVYRLRLTQLNKLILTA